MSINIARKFVRVLKATLIGRVVLFSFVGVVISLMQAWVSIALVDLDTSTMALDGVIEGDLLSRGKGPLDADGHAWRFEHVQYCYAVESVFCHSAWMPDELHPWDKRLGQPSSYNVLPDWSRAKKMPTIDAKIDREYVLVYELAAGWPFKSWYGQVYSGGMNSYKLNWAIGYHRPPVVGPTYCYAALPIRPGIDLFYNALFYGVLLMASWFGTLFVINNAKRAYRVRRSQCPNCSYLLDNQAICPECGRENSG